MPILTAAREAAPGAREHEPGSKQSQAAEAELLLASTAVDLTGAGSRCC